MTLIETNNLYQSTKNLFNEKIINSFENYVLNLLSEGCSYENGTAKSYYSIDYNNSNPIVIIRSKNNIFPRNYGTKFFEYIELIFERKNIISKRIDLNQKKQIITPIFTNYFNSIPQIESFFKCLSIIANESISKKYSEAVDQKSLFELILNSMILGYKDENYLLEYPTLTMIEDGYAICTKYENNILKNKKSGLYFIKGFQNKNMIYVERCDDMDIYPKDYSLVDIFELKKESNTSLDDLIKESLKCIKEEFEKILILKKKYYISKIRENLDNQIFKMSI